MIRRSLLISFFVAMPALAATSTATNTSTTTATPTAPHTVLGSRYVTAQIIGVSSEMDLDSSITVGDQTQNGGGSFSGTTIGGLQLGLNQRIDHFIGFSIDGALYQRKFDSSSASGFREDASIKTWNLRTTGMARIFFAPEFSVGAGPYLGTSIGDAKVTKPNGDDSNQKFRDLNRFDYGLAFGAQIAIPVSETAAFIADGRYYYGLANLANVDQIRSEAAIPAGVDFDASANTRDFQFGAGLAVNF